MAEPLSNPTVTQARLRELFDYDPSTGVFVRIRSTRSDMLGVCVGPRVAVDGHQYIKSRIIWLWYYGEWPKGLVDHANRNDDDNSIKNLRDATVAENTRNGVYSNPHGLKGVTFRDRGYPSDRKHPWLAKIRVNGRRINLGSFATKEEAAAAYEAACLKYHEEFAQLGVK